MSKALVDIVQFVNDTCNALSYIEYDDDLNFLAFLENSTDKTRSSVVMNATGVFPVDSNNHPEHYFSLLCQVPKH